MATPDEKDLEIARLRAALAERDSDAELERRVAERTRGLVEANTALEEELARRTSGASMQVSPGRHAEQAEALAASERQLQLTIDTIPALAWTARTDGTGEFFNQHYLDYVGLSLQDVQDWKWARLIHAEDAEVIATAWQLARAQGQAVEAEARIRRHDGEYRWFSFRANPLRDASGNVVKWYGVNVDIEEQKRATSLLSGERQLLELIASGRPLNEVLGALCSLVERALPGCHCEVRPIDAIGSTYEYGVAPSLPASFTADVPGAALDGSASPHGMAAAENTQVIATDISAEPRWQSTSLRAKLLEHDLRSVWITPIPSKDGRVVGLLGVYHREPAVPQSAHLDVIGRAVHTASIAIERLRAEDRLRRSEFLLATAERISETGSFAWDLNGDNVIFSAQMRRIFELDDDFGIVRPDLRSLYHPDDLPIVDAKIARVMNGEDCPENVERLLMPDGRIKYASNSFRVFQHEDGRRECIGILQDITRRRLAEDALDRVRSELTHATRVTSLGELAASIAHEVNQPLSGIVTNAGTCLRMLAAEPPDIAGAARTAQRTIRDGNRAGEVVQRLRTLFRKQEFVPQPLDLNEAVREIAAVCSHDFRRRGIRLEVELEPSLPSIVGDRIQLQQVFLNLMLNAADAVASAEHPPRSQRVLRARSGCKPLKPQRESYSCRFGILAAVSQPMTWTRSSSRSLRPSPTEWVWAFR
jgi:PAS domain S-box-containing protein